MELSEPRNIVDVLRARAADTPLRRAYVFLGDGRSETQSLTFGELDKRARAIGWHLRQRLPPRARALLLFQPGLGFVEAFYGCLYGVVTAVPLLPPSPARLLRTLPRLIAVARDADAAAVLCDPGVQELVRPQAAALDRLAWIVPADLTDPEEADWSPRVSGGQPAFLQYTSGSTGQPKGVVVSHTNVIHNERRLQQALRMSENSTCVGWTPLEHDMGLLANMILPAFSGSLSVLMAPLAFLKRPLCWLEAIQRYGAQVSGGPNFAYEMLAQKVKTDQIARLDLGCWDTAFVSAEPIRAETLIRFRETFAPAGLRWSAMCPAYGLAESTLMVSVKPNGLPPVLRTFDLLALERGRATPADLGTAVRSRTLVSSGRPTEDDQEVAIVDQQTCRRLPAGEVGEVWLRSPSVAQGYWNNEEATSRDFGAQIHGQSGRTYLRTGDLGLLLEGELFIVGRSKDLIIVDGSNQHPSDIEATVARAHPALAGCASAAFSVDDGRQERFTVVAEVNRRVIDSAGAEPAALEPVTDAIRQSITEEHGVVPRGIFLVPLRSLPKTSSGKIQRYLCREMLVAGELSLLARWSVGA